MRPRLSRRVLLVTVVAVAGGLGLAALSLAAVAALILPTHTPGARFSRVSQGSISRTICVRGWTATIRPPASYTSSLKEHQLAEWHYVDRNPRHYEEDHLISLELGGAPYSKRNLWPEPLVQAHRSDPRENAWNREVCDGYLTLQQAQLAELDYKRHHG